MNLEEALDIINQLGLGLGVTHSKEFELKGYCPDAEDGGLCKFYLCTEEVRQLADAFSAIVDIAGGVSSVAAESERCAGICKEIAEEYGRLSTGQSARVDALRHGLRAIANKARSPAEIIASRVLAADDASTEINQSVGYAVARECERRIRGEK